MATKLWHEPHLRIGLMVETPLGRIGVVTAMRYGGDKDAFDRVTVRYCDETNESVMLQPSLLKICDDQPANRPTSDAVTKRLQPVRRSARESSG